MAFNNRDELSNIRTKMNRAIDRVVDVRDFGAAGDGVADDTAAMQSAATEARISGKQMFIGAGSFKCGALDFRGVKNITCHGKILSVALPADGAAVLIGRYASPLELDFGSISLRVDHADGTNAGISGLSAVRARGLRNARVDIMATYFDAGLLADGVEFDDYVAFCSIIRLRTYGCKYGLLINQTNPSFYNENEHYNISIDPFGSALAGGSFGISVPDGARGPNNCLFVKPSLELTDTPIYLSSGGENKFIQPRLEGAGAIYLGEGAGNNIIEAQYAQPGGAVSYNSQSRHPNKVSQEGYFADFLPIITVSPSDWTQLDTSDDNRKWFCQKLESKNYGSGSSGPNYFEFATVTDTSFTIGSNDYAYIYVPAEVGAVFEITCGGRWHATACDASRNPLPNILSSEAPYLGTGFRNHEFGTSYTGSGYDADTLYKQNAARQIRVNRSDVKFVRFEFLYGVSHPAIVIWQAFDSSRIASGAGAISSPNDIKFITDTTERGDRFGQMAIKRGTSEIYINTGGTNWVQLA